MHSIDDVLKKEELFHCQHAFIRVLTQSSDHMLFLSLLVLQGARIGINMTFQLV